MPGPISTTSGAERPKSVSTSRVPSASSGGGWASSCTEKPRRGHIRARASRRVGPRALRRGWNVRTRSYRAFGRFCTAPDPPAQGPAGQARSVSASAAPQPQPPQPQPDSVAAVVSGLVVMLTGLVAMGRSIDRGGRRPTVTRPRRGQRMQCCPESGKVVSQRSTMAADRPIPFAPARAIQGSQQRRTGGPRRPVGLPSVLSLLTKGHPPMRSLRPVAGAALVSAALLALAGCSLIGGASDPERDDSGTIVASDDDADVFALRVGDCMASTDEATEVQTVPTRPCTELHDSEIFASTTL